MRGSLNASSSSSAPERELLRDSYLPGGVQGADQGPEAEAGGGRGGELGRAVAGHDERGQRLRVGCFPIWTEGFLSHVREADSRRVREKSRVASVGRHRRGRACAPRITVLPPIGGEVILPRSRLPFQPALPTVCSYKKLEDGDQALKNGSSFSAFDRASRKVRTYTSLPLCHRQ